MTSEEQLDRWVAGESVHNEERGECCPDFSCCEPSLLAPFATREAFARASDGERAGMLMGFLGAGMAILAPDKKVHIAGDPTNYEETS